MFSTDCIKDPNFIFSRCISVDKETSTCLCNKLNLAITTSIYKNEELYNEKYIKKEQRHTFESKSSETKILGILDCHNKQGDTFWSCSTYENNKNKTFCQCHNSLVFLDHIISLNTFDVYKQLNQMNIHISNNLDENGILAQSDNNEEYKQKSNIIVKVDMNSDERQIYHIENHHSKIDMAEIIFFVSFIFFVLFLSLYLLFKSKMSINLKKRTKNYSYMRI